MWIYGQKIQTSRFISTELKSNSESSESNLESEVDNGLMTKLESGFDSE